LNARGIAGRSVAEAISQGGNRKLKSDVLSCSRRSLLKKVDRETLTVRRMAETDAEVVATLAGELGYPSEAEAIRARIQAIGESDLLLVAVDEGDKPVGFIQAHRVCIIEVGFRVEILGLVVSSSARRGGIGRRLIAEAERWAESIGAEAISVRSSTKRIEAHLFYPALGYKKIKTQAVYEKAAR
jgi:GNAT superfamily N-acetyltransferase